MSAKKIDLEPNLKPYIYCDKCDIFYSTKAQTTFDKRVRLSYTETLLDDCPLCNTNKQLDLSINMIEVYKTELRIQK